METVAGMNTRRPFLGLLQRRQCVVPTWRGWLLLLLAFGTLGAMGVRGLYNFLAVNEPISGGILVVEGWSPDYVIEGAAEDFWHDGYKLICVTGGPIEIGNALREFHTYAECGRALLLKFGVPDAAIHIVPAASVERDRTYASGVALKRWIEQGGTPETRINISGNGPHSRRTRFLYQKALGSGFQVGISNVEEKTFDPKAWWKSSQGFRIVMDESIAYAYARLFFSPPRP
jgi:hypothetical protein